MIDVNNEENSIPWSLDSVEFVYPQNGPIPSTEMTEAKFRKTFIVALARHLAKSFYAYEVREDFGYDPTVVN